MGPQGPAGPTGPTGPQGPQGPAGPAGTQYLVFSGQLDGDGFGAWYIPSNTGVSMTNPPGVLCYASSSPDGPFFAQGTVQAQDSVCGYAQNTNGMYAFIWVTALSGWYYHLVVSYRAQ